MSNLNLQAGETPALGRGSWGLLESFRRNIRQYTMFIALIGIWLIFTILTKGIFISTRNLSNLFLQTSAVAILATGIVLILVAGQIDLSLGYFLSFIGGIVGALQLRGHMTTIPSMAIGLGAALLVGCWHGYWIAYRKIPAFIVTLASQLVLRGAMLAVTRGQTQTPLKTGFLAIGQGYLPQLGLFKNDSTVAIMVIVMLIYLIVQIQQRRSMKRNGYEVLPAGRHALKILGVCAAIVIFFGILISYLGIPYAIFIVMVLGLLFTYISNNSVFGRQVYAIGGNAEAARLSGIDIRKRIFTLYILMAALVAIAAFVLTARLGGASTLTGGGMELDAIAAGFIGGTSVSGGIGTIPGALVGALVMASIDNGMSLMDLTPATQLIVKGLILLSAVWIDIVTRNSRRGVK
jgi:D-xylose transport system permease protein